MMTPDEIEAIFHANSLSDMERLYKQGQITEEDATALIRRWNAGKRRLTQCVLFCGCFRNYESTENFHHSYREKYGTRF